MLLGLQIEGVWAFFDKFHYLHLVIGAGQLTVSRYTTDAMHDMKSFKNITELQFFYILCFSVKGFLWHCTNGKVSAKKLRKYQQTPSKTFSSKDWIIVEDSYSHFRVSFRNWLPPVLSLPQSQSTCTLDRDAFSSSFAAFILTNCQYER